MKKNNYFFRIMLLLCALLATGFSPLKNVKTFTLPNGLQCILKEDHSQKVISLQVWVRVGSINENADINGISHFFEHMMFKGTARYPGGQMTRIVEARGGSINAATSAEYTLYYIDVPSQGLEDAIAVLSDAIMYSEFPAEELEKERLVILEEIKRKNDVPESTLWDNLMQELYQTTPYQYKVIGTTTVVRSLTRDTLKTFHKTYYQPSNMAVILVGDFNAAYGKKLLRRYFSLPRSEKSISLPNLIEPVKDTYSVHVSSKSVKQTHIAVGYLGPVFDDNDQYALDVCAGILGNGRTSRLNRRIREEKKLVWSIGSYFYTHEGSGMFIITASCDPANKNDVIEAIQTEIESLIAQPPNPDELNKAKRMIESRWVFDNETFHEQGSNLGYYGVMNKLPFLKKYMKKIKQVQAQDIERVVRKYLDIKRRAISLVVPQ